MENFSIFFSEVIGTFLLIFIGCSVSASVSLKKTHSHNSGWIVITFGWGLAVMIGATAAFVSGGHLNPAVTLAIWVEGDIDFVTALMYFFGEILGAFLGALMTIVLFWDHFKKTEDSSAIAGSFYTSPAIPNRYRNFLTEVMATMVLILSLLTVNEWSVADESVIFGPLFAGLVVLGIGLTLGGLTGYAINPVRDLMPRLAHTLIKIPNKSSSSNWSYAWIPGIAPLVGSLTAVGIYEAMLATV